MLDKVEKYYTGKVKEFGVTPKGVDWKDQESQELRFEQLTKVVDWSEPASINDLGCGYGALLNYIMEKKLPLKCYCGYDISETMVSRAWADHIDFIFIVSSRPKLIADYTVASGIFNVKLDTPEEKWEEHMRRTILGMWQKSRKGIAFNCLTDKVDYREPHLYYTSPDVYIKLCQILGGKTELLENYGLYEWTILSRRK